MKPVLICGGVGTKMWPLSRVKHPKHFLPLFGNQSLYKINYQLLLKKFRPDEIYILTTSDQIKTALLQAPGVPYKNCIIEPELRNHGPAMGLMAAKLSAIDPDEPFFLVQVDNLRRPGEMFLKMIDECDRLVTKEGKLITGGIRPEYLIGGVDYLLAGEPLKGLSQMKIFKMKKWLWRDVEEKKLEDYFQKNLLFAHANHYCWTPRLLLEAYQRKAPDWYSALKKVQTAIGQPDEERVIKREYSKMVKARVERVTSFELESGYIVELPFQWIDFGTWESLARFYETEKITFRKENYLEIESDNFFISSPPGKFVATIGVKDLVIVDTGDGLLVCHKDQTGKVGKVVEYLREKKKLTYL